MRVEQQVASSVADALIALYAAESTVVRVGQSIDGCDRERARVLEAIARLVVHERGEEIRRITFEILAHVVPGHELGAARTILKGLLEPLNATDDVMSLRRTVADHAITAGRYDF